MSRGIVFGASEGRQKSRSKCGAIRFCHSHGVNVASRNHGTAMLLLYVYECLPFHFRREQ